MKTKIAVHVADASHMVHAGGEVIHKTFLVEVESEELEQALKCMNQPQSYTSISLSFFKEQP